MRLRVERQTIQYKHCISSLPFKPGLWSGSTRGSTQGDDIGSWMLDAKNGTRRFDANVHQCEHPPCGETRSSNMRQDVYETLEASLLELWRRASIYGDLEAWRAFQQSLEETVLTWLH